MKMDDHIKCREQQGKLQWKMKFQRYNESVFFYSSALIKLETKENVGLINNQNNLKWPFSVKLTHQNDINLHICRLWDSHVDFISIIIITIFIFISIVRINNDSSWMKIVPSVMMSPWAICIPPEDFLMIRELRHNLLHVWCGTYVCRDQDYWVKTGYVCKGNKQF